MSGLAAGRSGPRGTVGRPGRDTGQARGRAQARAAQFVADAGVAPVLASGPRTGILIRYTQLDRNMHRAPSPAHRPPTSLVLVPSE